MERYVCLHGHFYQPPRENPWLEIIEPQDSAAPFRDWNERITFECYAANAAARILNQHGQITRIVNNYSKMSFNFGPTLLSWLEIKHPSVYGAVLEADKESRRIFSGHSSAMAQVYNHMILPLAHERDKYTQIRWGIRDFEFRFGHLPEGMWLSETAVDLQSLDMMAESGIQFTVLSPQQARQTRKIGARTWKDSSVEKIDPSKAYLINLQSGRKMNIFFYDEPVSRAVAFERLLENGETFAKRLLNAFSDSRHHPQLVHIATDGETYGHHHKFGDMALAYAIHHIESKHLAKLTNYAEFLDMHPPTDEVQIFENSSWSCPHGVERWRSDCGCRIGAHPKWSQAWRLPLREALDGLRDGAALLFEKKAGKYLKDPWNARNEYIRVILDRSEARKERFLIEHAVRELNAQEKVTVFKCLELQRYAMLMYTSCAWFFDELSGIETVQILQYAGRVVQLAEEISGKSFQAHFLDQLVKAKSNIEEHQDGKRIYQKFVKPAMVSLAKIGALYAESALFRKYSDRTRIYCYMIERKDEHFFESDKTKLVVGQIEVKSETTGEIASLIFVSHDCGKGHVDVGVREFTDQETYQTLIRDFEEVFSKGASPEVFQIMDKHYLFRP